MARAQIFTGRIPVSDITGEKSCYRQPVVNWHAASRIQRMCRRLAVATAIVLFILHAAIAQTVSRAYSGEDGKAHVVYSNGAAKTIPPEQQQVGCEDISVAGDEHTVGWSVLVENCCTSYPIPTAVVVYRKGKKAVIWPGQMIHEWHFIGRGERLAVLSGPVHGYAARANLYAARSGKVLASWNGKGAAPTWAEGWEEHFEQ